LYPLRREQSGGWESADRPFCPHSRGKKFAFLVPARPA
jgi:hypothetical protein